MEEEQALSHRKTHKSVAEGGSALQRYRDVIVGHRSLLYLLYFELCCWMRYVPGAAGLLLRKIFWPRLFASCGRGVLFGEGIVLRHPRKIKIGSRVILSEGCVLDGRNSQDVTSIEIGDDVIFSNNVVVSCKHGPIVIGARVGAGAHTVFVTGENCQITVGTDVAIGPNTTIATGGYSTDRLDIPIIQQGLKPDRVVIENDVWLGAGVCAIGGARIQTGSIVAAGAVVIGPIEPRSIAGGVPARVLRTRAGVRGE